MKGESEKLIVFDVGIKGSKKCVEEFEINSLAEMHYLEIDSLSAMKNAYLATI